MTRITDIDANFRQRSTLGEEPIRWFDEFTGPFRIHGTCEPVTAGPYCRLPPERLDGVNDGVLKLVWYTAGVRLRFRTDSPFLAIKAGLSTAEDMSHMPRSGSSGFDLYLGAGRDARFVKAFMPEAQSDAVSGDIRFAGEGWKDVTLNFPLYNGVSYLAVGLAPGSAVEPATPYRVELPVVFYGSSITQGGCASRPGTCYPAILSRIFDMEHINLGFSGSARGEIGLAEYIASLPMKAFVLDYDHNAPTVEHLEETHHRFFRAIRDKNPTLPVLMMTKPDIDLGNRDHLERRRVVFDSYRKALMDGDSNVHWLDGASLFGSTHRDGCTVDGCHPNDLGFMRMAEAVSVVLERMLEGSK